MEIVEERIERELYQNELRQKYNPDDIFKNNNKPKNDFINSQIKQVQKIFKKWTHLEHNFIL